MLCVHLSSFIGENQGLKAGQSKLTFKVPRRQRQLFHRRRCSLSDFDQMLAAVQWHPTEDESGAGAVLYAAEESLI